jgi:hypothetical protein
LREAFFDIDKPVPQEFPDFFFDSRLRDIVKFKKNNYYIVHAGDFTTGVRIIIMQRGKAFSAMELVKLKKEFGVEKQHWLIPTDERLIFTNWEN